MAFAEMKNNYRRRTAMGAIGAWWWWWLGVGKAADAPPVGKPSKNTPVQELCVECLSKRARQRTAFINKWI